MYLENWEKICSFVSIKINWKMRNQLLRQETPKMRQFMIRKNWGAIALSKQRVFKKDPYWAFFPCNIVLFVSCSLPAIYFVKTKYTYFQNCFVCVFYCLGEFCTNYDQENTFWISGLCWSCWSYCGLIKKIF